jgi:hypothetical protein
VLKKYGIKKNEIDIFVADKSEKEKYLKELGRGYNIIIGIPGIKNIRNFMVDFYHDKEFIFYLDDDIYEIEECKYSRERVISYLEKKGLEINEYNILKNSRSGNYLEPIENLRDFIKIGYEKILRTGYKIFGVYPARNPYFMKNSLSFSCDLKYIIGFCVGMINDKQLKRTIDDKEDYENSILYYKKYGGVIRFNNITCKTNCYFEVGGMQETRTKERVMWSAKYLTKLYPEYCSLNLSKKSGFAELRLKDKTKK